MTVIAEAEMIDKFIEEYECHLLSDDMVEQLMGAKSFNRLLSGEFVSPIFLC